LEYCSTYSFKFINDFRQRSDRGKKVAISRIAFVHDHYLKLEARTARLGLVLALDEALEVVEESLSG
jgi:hypothetical protein